MQIEITKESAQYIRSALMHRLFEVNRLSKKLTMEDTDLKEYLYLIRFHVKMMNDQLKNGNTP